MSATHSHPLHKPERIRYFINCIVVSELKYQYQNKALEILWQSFLEIVDFVGEFDS